MAKKIVPSFVSLLFFALAAFLGWLLISSLGTLIPAAADKLVPDSETAQTVRAVFSPLAEAVYTPHILIPAAAASGFALMRFLLVPKHGFVTFLYVLLGIVLWLVIFLSSALLARINGIRILDIVTVLTDLIRGGLFEIL